MQCRYKPIYWFVFIEQFSCICWMLRTVSVQWSLCTSEAPLALSWFRRLKVYRVLWPTSIPHFAFCPIVMFVPLQLEMDSPLNRVNSFFFFFLRSRLVFGCVFGGVIGILSCLPSRHTRRHGWQIGVRCSVSMQTLPSTTAQLQVPILPWASFCPTFLACTVNGVAHGKLLVLPLKQYGQDLSLFFKPTMFKNQKSLYKQHRTSWKC